MILKELDPLLHSELRLAIMSVLLSVAEADFIYLQEICSATAGNLSVQLNKLHKANYIVIKKGFVGKRPRTTCSITKQGKIAFNQYIEDIKSYLHL